MTYQDLKPGDEIVIDFRYDFAGNGRYYKVTVAGITEKKIKTTLANGRKMDFNRRNGKEWGSGDSYRANSIATHYRGGFWTYADADAANREIDLKNQRNHLAVKINKVPYRHLQTLPIETLEQIIKLINYEVAI